MTREEALDATVAGMIVNRDYVRDTINTIFDDIETRTCANCKHCSISKTLIHNRCTLGIKQQFDIGVSAYFGCNKFEREQD